MSEIEFAVLTYGLSHESVEGGTGVATRTYVAFVSRSPFRSLRYELLSARRTSLCLEVNTDDFRWREAVPALRADRVEARSNFVEVNLRTLHKVPSVFRFGSAVQVDYHNRIMAWVRRQSRLGHGSRPLPCRDLTLSQCKFGLLQFVLSVVHHCPSLLLLPRLDLRPACLLCC